MLLNLGCFSYVDAEIMDSKEKYLDDAINEYFIKYKPYNLYHLNKDKLVKTDKEVFKILVTSNDEIDSYLKLFSKYKIRNNQHIEIKTVGIKNIDLLALLTKNCSNDILAKIKIYIDDFKEVITYEELKKMVYSTDGFYKKEDNESSQLEIIFDAYNETKKHIFNIGDESDLEHKNDSRLLSKVLTNEDERIVCVGYVKVFMEILRNNNIKSYEYDFIEDVDGKEVGHSVCLVNVDDFKYNIHGIYVFDITDDSYSLNKDSIDNDTRYKSFLLSIDEFKSMHKITYDLLDRCLFKSIDELREDMRNYDPNDIERDDDLFKAYDESFEFDLKLMKDTKELIKAKKIEENYYRNYHIKLARYFIIAKTSFGERISIDDDRLIKLFYNKYEKNIKLTLKALISRHRGATELINVTEKVMKLKK